MLLAGFRLKILLKLTQPDQHKVTLFEGTEVTARDTLCTKFLRTIKLFLPVLHFIEYWYWT